MVSAATAAAAVAAAAAAPEAQSLPTTGAIGMGRCPGRTSNQRRASHDSPQFGGTRSLLAPEKGPSGSRGGPNSSPRVPRFGAGCGSFGPLALMTGSPFSQEPGSGCSEATCSPPGSPGGTGAPRFGRAATPLASVFSTKALLPDTAGSDGGNLSEATKLFT